MKHRLLVGLLFGVALASTAGWVFTALAWHRSIRSPQAAAHVNQAWDSAAITAEFDSADIEGDNNRLVFFYTIENHTDGDFDFEDQRGIFVAAKRQKHSDLVFAPMAATIDYPPILPAKGRVGFRMHFAYSCHGLTATASKDEISHCLSDEFPGLAGFVVFDQPSRIRIDFPAPR